MRILVLSDSHGKLSLIEQACDMAGRVDMCIHLGDNAADAEHLRGRTDAGLYIVRGNCDFGFAYETERITEVSGKRIFMTHGHTYGVKSGLDRLFYRAKELEADIALFGHTHTPLESMEEGILFLNPGSILPSYSHISDFAVLTIDQQGIHTKKYTL